MWIVCITSVRHVLTVNGYGGRQTKENEKSWCFKGWETLVTFYSFQNSLAEIINPSSMLNLMDLGKPFKEQAIPLTFVCV